MADVSRGLYEIERQIARLRAVADLPKQAAPACSDALREYVERQISAGRAPDGSTWAPRKEDGGRAMAGAAKALTVVPVGSHVFARIKGPEARHHKGIAKGGVVRQILPTTEIPPVLVRALSAAIEETFVRVMESR